MRDRIDTTIDKSEEAPEQVDTATPVMPEAPPPPSQDQAAPSSEAAPGSRAPSAGDDGERSREERAYLQQAGQGLITHLFAASKTVQLYDLRNRAAQRQLSEVAQAVHQILEREGEASLRLSGEFLHLNDERIPIDSQSYGPFEYIVEQLRKCEAERMVFQREVTAEELGLFLQVVASVEAVESAYEDLQASMAQAQIVHIETVKLEYTEQELADPDAEDELKLRTNRVYFRTVALMGEVLRTIEQRNMLQVRKAKRLTQQMVDIIQTDESMFVGLSSIKNFDSYTFMHSVNVCILSMLMGDRLRLGRSDVARLGVTALFHDIGKTYIPSSILNSTGELSTREWELMKYHTFFGVKELSRIKSLREAADAMFVALQHHVHLNNNGYPVRPGGWKLRLFSRIVTVADYYDAMTASRSYQKQPITPDRALRFIIEKSGKIFDPFVAKVFIQAMGLYPVGTIVELDSGETAVVVKQNPESRNIHRPIVEVVEPDADPSAERRSIDLAARAGDGHRFEASVRRTIHDSEIQLDRRKFFMM